MGIIGIVREHFEQVAPDDAFARGERRAQVCVARAEDAKARVGMQNQKQVWCALE